MTPDQAKSAFRPDPDEYPKRIELEPKEEIVKNINEMAQKSGRSFFRSANQDPFQGGRSVLVQRIVRIRHWAPLIYICLFCIHSCELRIYPLLCKGDY